MTTESYRALALDLAAASAEVILPYFANPDLGVELKTDNTPVTEADRQAEAVMRKLINDRFPDHGILGEEFGDENPEAEFRWILDPIDGTRAFTAGCPLFGTLICLARDGEPILGLIHNPVTGHLLEGDNIRTLLNGRPVRVSEATLPEALLVTTDLGTPAQEQDPERWNALVSSVSALRTWGDCFAYHLVATGGADIALDPVMNAWDLMALIPVVRGAGGTITDWQGNDPAKGTSIVAANPALHEQVMAILNPR